MPSAAAEARTAAMATAARVWRLNTASRLQPGSAGLTAASGQSRQTRKIAGYPGYILPMLHEAEAGKKNYGCKSIMFCPFFSSSSAEFSSHLRYRVIACSRSSLDKSGNVIGKPPFLYHSTG